MADVPQEGSAAGAVECPGETVRGSAKAVRNTEETRGPDEALRGLVLEVKPLVCLHDVLPSIRVSGLPPHTPLTLRADTHDDEGRKFSSYAHYTSDESGCVDVSSSESVGGSYTGVFPAGLLSSLRGVPDKFIRLWKTDCVTPWKVKVTASQGHLELEDEAVGEVSQVLHRHLLGPGVRRVPVRHGRVRGALYLPAGPGPFPGVVDVFGGFGGLLEYRAVFVYTRPYCKKGQNQQRTTRIWQSNKSKHTQNHPQNPTTPQTTIHMHSSHPTLSYRIPQYTARSPTLTDPTEHSVGEETEDMVDQH
nr:acyl-coenzyme A thioesterase 1-like [Cherax quadricarinatus]